MSARQADRKWQPAPGRRCQGPGLPLRPGKRPCLHARFERASPLESSAARTRAFPAARASPCSVAYTAAVSNSTAADSSGPVATEAKCQARVGRFQAKGQLRQGVCALAAGHE